MKSFFTKCLILMILTKGFSQDHYVSYIDFDNTGQFAWQIEQHKDDFLLSIQTACFVGDESCGGLILLNDQGVYKKAYLLDNFSGNPKSFRISKENILLSGEFDSNVIDKIYAYKLDYELNFIDSIALHQKSSKYYNYNAVSSEILLEKLLIVGTSFAEGECPQLGHIYFANFEGEIKDSLFVFTKRGYTAVVHVEKTKDDEFIIYTMYKDFDTDKDSIRILRLDTAFNQTFEWSMEVESNAIPRGCVTRDDNMIITIPEGFLGAQRNIWSIDTSGQTNWIYQWPQPQGKTNILRVEEAENGDLLVMGQILNITLLDDRRYVAFVMRLSPSGEEKWIRYFKIEDQDTRLSNYISDLVELENGDLQLTGQSRSIIFDGELGDFRPDQDILWARIGGDGCINGDCEDVYLVSNTGDTYFIEEGKILIYPNPVVDNQLNIEVKKGTAQTALIYGMDGQLIKAVDLTSRLNTLILDTNSSILLVRILDKAGRLIHSEKVLRF